jgi:hypothetical protein
MDDGDRDMLTTRHAVDSRYTRQELGALFRPARQEDVDAGGHDDARSAVIILWSHHWLNAAMTFQQRKVFCGPPQ